MKRIIIALLLTTTLLAMAQKETLNPWGLVYDGALTENIAGEVNIRPVTYMVDGISVAANVYLPTPTMAPRLPSVVCST